MRPVRTFGALLTGGACLAAWLSLAGGFVPAFDVLASFLPLFGAAVLAGLLLAGRRRSWTAGAALIGLLPVAIATVPEMMREIPAARIGSAEIGRTAWLTPARTADARDLRLRAIVGLATEGARAAA